MSAATSGVGHLLEQGVNFLVLRIVLLEALLATEDISFILNNSYEKEECYEFIAMLNQQNAELFGKIDSRMDRTVSRRYVHGGSRRTGGHAACILDMRVA